MTDVTNDFHKPFFKALLVVAFITVFAMVSSRIFIKYYFSQYTNHPVFTSAPSEITRN